MKAQLRGFLLAERKTAVDMVVIVHRNEGRLLLTDRNGLYNDVLQACWHATNANVVIIVTKVPTSPDTLNDSALVATLAHHADQPTIGALSAAGRLITYDQTPSQRQADYLLEFAQESFCRLPLRSFPGMPPGFQPAPRRPHTSRGGGAPAAKRPPHQAFFRCTLL
ncbi:unnamed protein product [Vitrella brassicaformis CCMP3155]|uniref:Uncharacterized protein n=1 Tax=Vitrella brassicaformis (strain CCMP3155) TaxID=1169540 RepID=A0A0G4EHK5_VITBC|nr:unnamed protein product [Vitrella brassicaformis CCMP3155]|eukprot:CEL95463.1 unnamed protein product [Vitrella brassicaformis CCMP3155]